MILPPELSLNSFLIFALLILLYCSLISSFFTPHLSFPSSFFALLLSSPSPQSSFIPQSSLIPPRSNSYLIYSFSYLIPFYFSSNLLLVSASPQWPIVEYNYEHFLPANPLHIHIGRPNDTKCLKIEYLV